MASLSSGVSVKDLPSVKGFSHTQQVLGTEQILCMLKGGFFDFDFARIDGLANQNGLSERHERALKAQALEQSQQLVVVTYDDLGVGDNTRTGPEFMWVAHLWITP
jgi:hypothetical protein